MAKVLKEVDSNRERVLEKKWPCPEPTCGYNLGLIIYGELIPTKGVEVKTDGPNLQLVCPKCKRIKTWFANDQMLRSLKLFVDSVASEMARRTLYHLRKAEDK